MRRTFLSLMIFLLPAAMFPAQEVSTFPAYVDSDLCSRLMVGPLDADRMECSKTTYKQGSDPVLIRLANNAVIEVNKDKPIKKLVGGFVTASGELNVQQGTMKLESATELDPASIPKGDPSRKLLDAGAASSNPELDEKIRHAIASLPYLSEFDFISFSESRGEVILTGWTLRTVNRNNVVAYVRSIPGVETVVDNIDLLPVSPFDMQVRAQARVTLEGAGLSRYFWGAGSDIKIIVKNQDIILIGTVTRKADSDMAFIKCNTLPNVFKVFNLLKVQPTVEKKG